MDILGVVNELKAIYKDQKGYPYPRVPGLKEADVQRWSSLLAVSRSSLYDQLAGRLARGFQSSELTFAFCDAVLNDLLGVITANDEHRPDLFWAVYLAFDEGEYYHGNNRDEDPQEAYTRPMISRLLKSVQTENLKLD